MPFAQHFLSKTLLKALPGQYVVGLNEQVDLNFREKIVNYQSIDLSTARTPVLDFIIYASLDWILILIWKPKSSIIISLTNDRTRWCR